MSYYILKQAIETILNYGKPIIVKPSVNTLGGKDITIYNNYQHNDCWTTEANPQIYR